MSALILASTSRYRKDLLSRLGHPFDCAAPDVDEQRLDGEGIRAMTSRLARAKAEAVAIQTPGAIVIGADQSAALHGQALGKPGTRQAAIEQLRGLSGQSVEFFSAVCVIDSAGQADSFCDTTRVRFRPLLQSEIERYVDREQPFDCAGSFKCEGLGISLFEAIETKDPTALIGLPLIDLARALRAAGLAIP